jgi:CubicO group peptidase (beta-lactamase class C family)
MIVVGGIIAAPFLLWLGVHTFMTTTVVQWHPDAREIPGEVGLAPSPAWTSAVDRAQDVVRAAIVRQNLPGVSVAVGAAGELVWAESFGWSDVDERVPLGSGMRFRIGTASMMLTSAAAGLLLEQGRLKLDEEIQTYVSAYPKTQWPVTLGQLMGHVSGVRNDEGDEGPFNQHCEQTLDGLRLFANERPLFEPGTRFHLSSFGWILVSAAIESASGEPFLDVMRTRIFEPLGMHDTLPDSTTNPVPDQPVFYFPRYAADPRYGLHGMGTMDFSCYAGASVFLSTPSDLVRFALAVQHARLLKPETATMLQTSQRLASGTPTEYGLGWDLESASWDGTVTRIVGHDGTVAGGMVATLATFPDHGIVVSVTSNIAYADTFSLAGEIARVFAASKK